MAQFNNVNDFVGSYSGSYDGRHAEVTIMAGAQGVVSFNTLFTVTFTDLDSNEQYQGIAAVPEGAIDTHIFSDFTLNRVAGNGSVYWSSVNQRLPSGPAVMPAGWLLAVGTGNSWKVPTLARAVALLRLSRQIQVIQAVTNAAKRDRKPVRFKVSSPSTDVHAGRHFRNLTPATNYEPQTLESGWNHWNHLPWRRWRFPFFCYQLLVGMRR